jgi:hypothetical protein
MESQEQGQERGKSGGPASGPDRSEPRLLEQVRSMMRLLMRNEHLAPSLKCVLRSANAIESPGVISPGCVAEVD